MDFVPKKKILFLRPDSEDLIYKNVNLEKPEDFKSALNSLKDWIDKQPHFKRKDFSDNYLRATILASKGSVELSKQKLDKICTLRTLLPESFRSFDVKEDFGNLFDVMKPIVLPQLDEEHCRIFIVKPYGDIQANHINNALKYTLVVGDYMKQCDIVCGFKGIFDLTQVNLLDVISKLNLMDLRHTLTVYFEGHGMRLKGIYFITTSKVIDVLIGLLKQVLKPKLVQRIKVFKSWEEIHAFEGKDIIPVDFGGYEKSEQEIHDQWIEELSSEEFKQYLCDINMTGTDETYRPAYKFNEEYAGLPGTFRILSVD